MGLSDITAVQVPGNIRRCHQKCLAVIQEEVPHAQALSPEREVTLWLVLLMAGVVRLCVVQLGEQVVDRLIWETGLSISRNHTVPSFSAPHSFC
ncbi:hypothetical protein AOLI_G00105820 [Acnodon oligacanthus]